MQTKSKLAAFFVTAIATGALVAAPPATASEISDIKGSSAAVDSVTTTPGDTTDEYHDA